MAEQVYFAKVGDRIKIGFSTSVPARLKSLATGIPDVIELLATIDGDRGVERAFHARLSKHRIRGEWFRDCEELREVMTAVGVGGVAVLGDFYQPMPAVTRRERDEPVAVGEVEVPPSMDEWRDLEARVARADLALKVDEAFARRAREESQNLPRGDLVRLLFPRVTEFDLLAYMRMAVDVLDLCVEFHGLPQPGTRADFRRGLELVENAESQVQQFLNVDLRAF